MTFLGLLDWIVAFVFRALCGLVLTALVPVFWIALLCGWVDPDTAWALKWVCLWLSPFFIGFCFIFWKALHLARTGRHIGMWATGLVIVSVYSLEFGLLYYGVIRV